MSETPLIRILLVDDHDMVRKGLGVFLSTRENFVLVGEATDGHEAIVKCQELHPDVVLMDLIMPGQDGIETIRHLRETQPHVQVIALTSYADDQKVQEALEAGAIGFHHKNVSIEQLAAAILAAYRGQPTLSPEATKAVFATARNSHVREINLTAREQEVLNLMIEGLSNQKIADRLTVGRATIKTHVSNILNKLDVENRQEAISRALREKLI